jgi:multidrug resistance efflux pump
MAEGRHPTIAIITRAFVSVAVLAAGAAILALFYSTRPQPPAPVDSVVVREVQVMRPAMVPVRREWTGFGAAGVMDSAAVPAEVTALVVEVPEDIRPGRRVDRGAVLARLDPVDFQQQLDLIGEQLNSIDAELEQLDVEEASWSERLTFSEEEERVALADLERVRELMQSGDATELELDRATSALAAARRALSAIREEVNKAGPRRLRLRSQRHALVIEQEIARRNLARTTITSPIAGTIESVAIDEGEQVIAGQTVASVVDLSRIELELRLPASARLHLRTGDEAEIIPAGVPDRLWRGRVARLGPRDDEATRTFPVYVEVDQDPSDPAALTPGLYVQAVLRSAGGEERALVPRRAVTRDRVLVVNEGRLVPAAVKVAFYVTGEFPLLGVPGERYWAALEEALPGEAVIVVNGSIEIPPGAMVRPVEAAISEANMYESADRAGGPGRDRP